jgi:hypothetical protein
MPCKLCHHPERELVEKAFASGMTDREIGRRFWRLAYGGAALSARIW